MRSSVSLKTVSWRLVAASILVVTAATQPAFIAAATIEQAGPEVGYGAQMLGFMTAAFFLTAAVSSRLIGGPVVERIGWRRSMIVNTAGAGIVSTSLGLFADSVSAMFVGLIAAAVVYGLANPAANLALAREVDPTRQGLIFGLKHAGIPTSSMLAGLAVPTIALTLGWRWVYGAAALLAALVLAVIPPERSASTPEAVPVEPPPGMSVGWLTLISLGSAFATVAAMALGTFHVDAAIERGFSEGGAGLLLAFGSAASIAARVAYGQLADRFRSNGLTWVAMATAAGAVTFFGFTVLPSGLFVAATAIAFATGWGWPGLVTFGVVRANEGRPAGSTAITQAGVFLGAGVGPAGLGWLIENRSYDAAWITTALSLTIATAIMLYVGRVGVRHVGRA